MRFSLFSALIFFLLLEENNGGLFDIGKDLINTADTGINTVSEVGGELVNNVKEMVPQNVLNATTSLTSVCYGELGCFGLLDNFDLFNRPINFLPESPENIDIQLNFFTSERKYKTKILRFNLSEAVLKGTDFDPKKATKFIIHGFGGDFDEHEWLGSIKDLLILDGPVSYNVFGVDWGGGAKKFLYGQAVANTRVVGAAIAHFIKKLVEYTGTNLTDIHLIGHSLGAHVSGFAGKRFNEKKLGRITALDPAGPDFQANNAESRLSPSDAEYIDVIHTDYGDVVIEGLGLKDLVGKDDFFPNGGYRQPGCGITKGVYNILSSGVGEGISSTVSCNHRRSWQLFLAALEPQTENCQFVGYECESFDAFKEGKCADGVKAVQFNPWGSDDPKNGNLFTRNAQKKSERNQLYFLTSDNKPFCVHHYQVIVHVDKSSRTTSGAIKLHLVGSLRSTTIELNKAFTSFLPGNNYTYLVTIEKSLGRVDEVQVNWSFGGVHGLNLLKLFGKQDITISHININYMSNIDSKVREAFSASVCPNEVKKIESGSSSTFDLCIKSLTNV